MRISTGAYDQMLMQNFLMQSDLSFGCIEIFKVLQLRQYVTTWQDVMYSNQNRKCEVRITNTSALKYEFSNSISVAFL